MQLQENLSIVLLHLLLLPCFVPPATSAEVGQSSANKVSTFADLNEEPNFATQILYHNSDVILTEVQALVSRHPEILSLEDLHAETDGYSAEMRVVTLEIGGKNTGAAEKWRLLLDFGQHGRELVTTEVALRLLSTLAGEHSFGSLDGLTLHRILTNSVIKIREHYNCSAGHSGGSLTQIWELIRIIIPIENVNGRKKVEAGDFCERKNGRGVDTNRNWGLDWGKKEKDYDPAEEYPGTAPFSEPETRILKGLAERFHPHLWVNVHSGMQALFMPYDHKATGPTDGSAEPMTMLLQTINSQHCRNSCVVGSGGGSVGYLAHGTATDFMFDALRVPIAFTFEIYGDSHAGNEACFRMFNPVSADHLEKVVSDWSAAFITLILHLPGAVTSMPGRVWSQARHIDLSGPVSLKLEGNDDSYGKSKGNRSVRLDAGIAHVLSASEAERTMHHFVIFLFVFWGCILLIARFRFCNNHCRWKKFPARHVDSRLSGYQI